MNLNIKRLRKNLYLFNVGILIMTLYDDQILFGDKIYRSIEEEISCQFNSTDIYDALTFFPVHLINWFFASLIARDFVFLHVWSVFDELIETSYQKVIPVVEECWWDRAILDVLVANNFSIWLGMWLSKRYFNLEQFDWFGRNSSYNPLRWKLFQDERRLMVVILAFLAIKINFLAGFLLIYSLNIEVFHWFCFFRLIVWFTLGQQCFALNYEYLTNNLKMNKETVKINLILVIFITLECFVIIQKLSNQTGLKHISEMSLLTPIFWQLVAIIIYGLFKQLKNRKTTTPYSFLQEILVKKKKIQ